MNRSHSAKYTHCLYIDGSVQDCSNSSELAMELLQSCTKPSIYSLICTYSFTDITLMIVLNLNIHNTPADHYLLMTFFKCGCLCTMLSKVTKNSVYCWLIVMLKVRLQCCTCIEIFHPLWIIVYGINNITFAPYQIRLSYISYLTYCLNYYLFYNYK